MWNLSVNHPMRTFIPLDAHNLHECWRWKWVEIDRQQDPPHLVLCSSRVKPRTKVEWPLLDKNTLHKSYSIPHLYLWTLKCLPCRFGLLNIGTIWSKYSSSFAASLGVLKVWHPRCSKIIIKPTQLSYNIIMRANN